MPSLRALGLGLVLLLQVATASPLSNRAVAAADCKPTSVSKPTGPAPTLPLTGGATELPTTNLTLQVVAIGRGIQNYTCSAIGAVPVQLGAIATLYDATSLAWTNLALLHTIPSIVVTKPLPPGYMAQSGQHFDVIGNHFFDSASTPTFILSEASPPRAGFMAKTLGVNAPVGASKGPAGTGAVAWLDLNNKPGYVQKNITQVYRVETAGGNNFPNCTSVGVQTVQYAAEYWFYNPV
ncbi:hypothetical protein N431DRAFT_500819 [Stipitochalara longipes BDJ]|nr:hypothetical protein N431DRAFT_500819 [Stipitochalara longipes BDJ]